MPNLSFLDTKPGNIQSTKDSPSTFGIPMEGSTFGESKYDRPVNYLSFLQSPDDYRHNNQGNLDIIANSLMHFSGSAVNAGLEIPAIAFGALKYPFTQIKTLINDNSDRSTLGKIGHATSTALTGIYDNEISRGVVDPINQWFQDTFKVYQSQAQKDSNFFSYENLASGHFLDALLSGAGYTAGSYLTGAALTKAFNLSKLAASGTKVLNAEEAIAKAASGVSGLKIPLNSQITLGTTMAAMESSLEARQTKDQILESLKDRNDLSEAQKENIANSGSLANFAFNMAILAPTNTLVFGKLLRPGADEIEAGLKTTLKEGKVVEDVIQNKYLRTAKNIIKNPVTEGVFAEGGQEYLQFASNEAINDYLDNKYHGRNADFLNSVGKALYDGLATKEGLENTVIGGLMGVAAGGLGHIRNAKNEKDQKIAQLDFINKNLPQISQVLKDKLLDTNRTLTYQQLADENISDKDKFNYYNDKHSALVSLVQQHSNAGTLGILIDRINDLKSTDPTELNKLFGNDVTLVDPKKWSPTEAANSLVKEIHQISKVQDAVKRILPNPYDRKTELPQYLAFRELQNLGTHIASSLDNTTSRIFKINADLNQFGITFNNVIYNNLTKKEKEDYLKSTEDEINEINPVHHSHLFEDVNDILNLNQRRKVFTEAYNSLTSEKGIKENLEKIETKQKETKDPIQEIIPPKPVINTPEVVPQNPPIINPTISGTQVDPNLQGEFNITIEKQGVLGNKIKVKVNSDGTWIDEKGNTYTKEQGYYIPGQTSGTKSGSAKQVLYDAKHFTRMWFQGLADNRGFASQTRELLNKIAKLSNWEDYINVTITKKQVNANLKEEQENGQRTLFGDKEIKLQGRYDIDILLQLTDPETGKIPEYGQDITGVNNPNLFVQNGETINFNDAKWTLTEFNKYFSFWDLQEKKERPFTETELATFKANWKALLKFNDAIVSWYSQQNSDEVPLPKEYLDYDLSGEISWNDDGVYTDINSTEFGDIFKDSPIINAKFPTESINGKSLENTPDPTYEIIYNIDERFHNSYFILANLPNGLQRWVRIQAKEVDAKNVLDNIKQIKSELDNSKDLTKGQIDNITDKLNFWIASLPGNVIKFVSVRSNGKNKLGLGYGKNGKITDRTPLPEDISTWTEVELLKFINTAITAKGIKEIDLSTFKESIEPNEGNIDQFVTQVNPEILTDYTLLFKFGTENITQEVVQKQEPVQTKVKIEQNPTKDSKEEIVSNVGSKYSPELQNEIDNAIVAGYSQKDIEELIKEWNKSINPKEVSVSEQKENIDNIEDTTAIELERVIEEIEKLDEKEKEIVQQVYEENNTGESIEQFVSNQVVSEISGKQIPLKGDSGIVAKLRAIIRKLSKILTTIFAVATIYVGATSLVVTPNFNIVEIEQIQNVNTKDKDSIVQGLKDYHFSLNTNESMIIVDKNSKSVVILDSLGNTIYDNIAIIGKAIDSDTLTLDSAKYYGQYKDQDRVTPSGDFQLKREIDNSYGGGYKYVLKGTEKSNFSVAFHAVVQEPVRLNALKSPSISDNNVSFGCISINKEDFKAISPFITERSHIYIIPENINRQAYFKYLKLKVLNSELTFEEFLREYKNISKTKLYSDESQISSEPRTYEEIKDRLLEQVPKDIGIERIENILSTLNVNGVPVSIFRDTTVYISDKMGYSDADHEAFHTIFNTVLTPDEQKRYLNAKKRELNYTSEQLNTEINDLLRKRPDLVQLLRDKIITRTDIENLVYEEFLSDEYADKRNNKELNQPKTWKNIIFDLFNKIINFFTGRVKIIDLFNKIDRGAFVNSSINSKNKISSIDKAKLIGGLTAEQSRNLIHSIVAKSTTNNLNINKVIDDLIKEYNPFSPENLAVIKSRESEFEKNELKKFLRTYNFGLKNNKPLIIDEATKYLKYLRYNPKKEEEDNFQEDTDKDIKEYDRLDSEINTLDRVSSEIKAFIGSSTYKVNFYGKEIETAVHFSRVYNKLLSILTNSSPDKVLSTIEALGSIDEEINAVFNKLHTEKGYSKESPKGITFNDQMFLTRFVKQFELARTPYVTAFENDKGELVISKINKHDAGTYTFDNWSTLWGTTVNDKFTGDDKFRKDLRYNLTLLVAKLEDKTIPDVWKYKKYKKSTAVKEILQSIGIELEKTYLEISLDNIDENSLIIKDLIEKEEGIITSEDILKLQNILFSNIGNTQEGYEVRNPFSDTGMPDRLLAIANSSAKFSTNFIIPNYRASDNTLRYTYVPYNQYLQSIRDTQTRFKTLKSIRESIKKGSYLSFNNLLNNENTEVSQENVKNLEVVFIGDNNFGKGKTYKDSTSDDVLKVLFTLFQNPDLKTNTYFTAPSVIGDKRSFYGVQVPVNNFYENGKITDKGELALKNIFTQEFKRLNGDFENTKANKIWIYLPMFNNHSELIQKIRNDNNRIDKYWNEVFPIIQEFINSEVSFLQNKIPNLSLNDANQFILNNFVNNISIQQLTEGDLSQLELKKGETWQEKFNKLFSERFKREASLNASGKDMGEGNDRVGYTEDTQAWVNKVTGEVTYTKPEGDKIKDFYTKPINPDDAQVWQTPVGRLRDMESLGTLTEVQYSALKKLAGKEIDPEGNPVYPTKEELESLDLISNKHVTAGFDTLGNRVYYKMSIAVLTPWDTGLWSPTKRQWMPKRGSEEGFYRWKLMNDNNLDLLVPKSASKVFFGKSISEINQDTKMSEDQIYEVPRKYRREQVLKESKDSNKVPWLTQIQQLIDFALLNNPENNVLREALQDVQVKLRNNTFKFLQDQIVDTNGELKEDLSYFLQKMRDIVEESTPDIQMIELLKDTFGKLDYTMNFAHNRQKMQQIFMSHFKPAFQHKLNGAKLTMVSPIIYRAVRDENGEVVPMEQRDPKIYDNAALSDLKVTWENGDPKKVYGEIVISAFTAKKLGLKIGDTVVSLRVPTQGYNFMGRSKVVDILPEYYGDIVIGAPQLTLYAGHDFDDDALYIFSKEKYETLTGEKFYGDETTLEEKWEGYKNWYVNNNTDVKKYLNNLVLQNTELQNLQKIDEILGTNSPRSVQIYDNLVQDTLKFFNLPYNIQVFSSQGSPESQGALNNQLINNLEKIIQKPELEKYFKQPSTTDQTAKTKKRIEKILKTNENVLNIFGISGLLKAWEDNTASTNLRGSTVLAQTTGANLTKNRVNLNPEFYITFNGIPYTSFNTPDEVTYEKNNKSSEKVSTSIDNSKEPMASTFHWTKNNVSTFSYLNQLGIDIEDGDGILSVQPSIIAVGDMNIREIPSEINTWTNKYNELIKQIKEKERFNSLLKDNNLTSKELWDALEYSTNSEKTLEKDIEYTITQIKALNLFYTAKQIADFAYNISQLNTLTRTNGSSFDDAQNFLDAYDNLTTEKRDPKGNIIPKPFDVSNVLKNEKNIVNNINNLRKVFNIGKHLFISQTKIFKSIQDDALKVLQKPDDSRNKKRIKADLSTYIQMQIYKTLNPDVPFNSMLIPGLGSKLITESFKDLMKFDEFRLNKFIKYLSTKKPGEKGNNSPLSILKFDSVTSPTKELSELFIDSINQLANSENTEIRGFAKLLIDYQAGIGNMEFLNNSFMRFIPVSLLKPLAQQFQRLNEELAKQNPSNDVIKEITGKSVAEMRKEFILNFIGNTNNNGIIDDKSKEYKLYLPNKQSYRFSLTVGGNEYLKPWINTPERNKKLNDELLPKVKEINASKAGNDYIPNADDAPLERNTDPVFDDLDTSTFIPILEENSEIQEKQILPNNTKPISPESLEDESNTKFC
jgi:hypothetical protein